MSNIERQQMGSSNCGWKFDEALLMNGSRIDPACVNTYAEQLQHEIHSICDTYRAGWLVRAVTCLDLTALSGDDTESNIHRLCQKACSPISKDLLNQMGINRTTDGPTIQTAAICVYPSRIGDAVEALKHMKTVGRINIASVASGFPSGQTPLKIRLDEISHAIKMGANEIDVVITRPLVLKGQWYELYNEIKKMKQICGHNVHLKTILSTGELGSLQNVYKASMVAMMAGSDFIKTSTGKEVVNATLPFGITMSRAIIDFYNATGVKIGLKPAGGLKTADDAILWLKLMNDQLGSEWTTKHLFRIGASGLLNSITNSLFQFVNGHLPLPYEYSFG